MSRFYDANIFDDRAGCKISLQHADGFMTKSSDQRKCFDDCAFREFGTLGRAIGRSWIRNVSRGTNGMKIKRKVRSCATQSFGSIFTTFQCPRQILEFHGKKDHFRTFPQFGSQHLTSLSNFRSTNDSM